MFNYTWKLNIDNKDLTSILSNLIDNSLESETKYNLKDVIEIFLEAKNNYLFIKVINTIFE